MAGEWCCGLDGGGRQKQGGMDSGKEGQQDMEMSWKWRWTHRGL